MLAVYKPAIVQVFCSWSGLNQEIPAIVQAFEAFSGFEAGIAGNTCTIAGISTFHANSPEIPALLQAF